MLCNYYNYQKIMTSKEKKQVDNKKLQDRVKESLMKNEEEFKAALQRLTQRLERAQLKRIADWPQTPDTPQAKGNDILDRLRQKVRGQKSNDQAGTIPPQIMVGKLEIIWKLSLTGNDLALMAKYEMIQRSLRFLADLLTATTLATFIMAIQAKLVEFLQKFMKERTTLECINLYVHMPLLSTDELAFVH